MAELSLSDDESDSDIKYAVVMTNISQLEQTSEEHEVKSPSSWSASGESPYSLVSS